jgi:hypothetical protein
MKTYRGRRQHQAPGALDKGGNPGTHTVEVWVGPRVGLDILEKKTSPIPCNITN